VNIFIHPRHFNRCTQIQHQSTPELNLPRADFGLILHLAADSTGIGEGAEAGNRRGETELRTNLMVAVPAGVEEHLLLPVLLGVQDVVAARPSIISYNIIRGNDQVNEREE
jgi:hypothetical protein